MTAAKRLRDLPGLGPASEAMLVEAGIGTPAALRREGAVGAFVAVERACGPTSINLLYALAGALEGRPWIEMARRERQPLLMELEDRRDVDPNARTLDGGWP